MIVQQQRFRVVFSGEFDPGHTLEQVQTALARRFKLKPAVLRRLMAGRPIVVKNNVDAETAYRYKAEIDRLGGVSRIEPMPAHDDVDPKGFIERRRTERRRGADRRRASRPGSIQPDRRRVERRANWPPADE